MIATELYDGQGMGNQLWAYVVTRLVAKHKGCDFYIKGEEHFKGRGFMKLDFGTPFEPTNYYREKECVVNGNSMWDFDPELYNVPLGTKIEGNFQSYQYIRGHEDEVRSWFNLPSLLEMDENTCLVHIRLGDYKGIPEFLPITYFDEAMREFPGKSFIGISDEPEIAEKVLGIPFSRSPEDKYKASHHRGGDIGTDFMSLVSARNLIIPNSSFAWWGAFLNTRKEKVIAPLYWAGYNKGFWQTADIKTDGFTYI